MKTAIVSVGTELLFGQITNTNSVYLSQNLQLLGHDVMYHYTVGDNPDRLRKILDLAWEDCDLILTTGGLGPTQDDLTKETVAEALHDHLVLHETTVTEMEAYFQRLGRVMTENNRKQAWLPSRATIFDNAQGTAPGFALEYEGKCAVCMPGPPREMKGMFESCVRPWLQEKSPGVIYYRMLRTFGIGESALETELSDLITAQTDPTLATYAKEGECSLRIASKRQTEAEAREAVEAMRQTVMKRVGQYVYSDSDQDLSAVVAERLLLRGISVSCAESCTGGLFAGALTAFPGISAIFDRGFVTYSNRAKMESLGVSRETLETYGAVSRETALAMAEGVRAKTGSRLCISVTGIAGPDGGSEAKPAGLIYIGCLLDGRSVCREIRMRNVSRAWNRNHAVLNMFAVIHQILLEM